MKRDPREILKAATARALAQPGAKWTPATGWTDEPIPAVITLDPETQEQLIDLLELIAAGSTAKTLASRAAAILPHLKGA